MTEKEFNKLKEGDLVSYTSYYSQPERKVVCKIEKKNLSSLLLTVKSNDFSNMFTEVGNKMLKSLPVLVAYWKVERINRYLVYHKGGN